MKTKTLYMILFVLTLIASSSLDLCAESKSGGREENPMHEALGRFFKKYVNSIDYDRCVFFINIEKTAPLVEAVKRETGRIVEFKYGDGVGAGENYMLNDSKRPFRIINIESHSVSDDVVRVAIFYRSGKMGMVGLMYTLNKGRDGWLVVKESVGFSV